MPNSEKIEMLRAARRHQEQRVWELTLEISDLNKEIDRLEELRDEKTRDMHNYEEMVHQTKATILKLTEASYKG